MICYNGSIIIDGDFTFAICKNAIGGDFTWLRTAIVVGNAKRERGVICFISTDILAPFRGGQFGGSLIGRPGCFKAADLVEKAPPGKLPAGSVASGSGAHWHI